MSKKKIMAEEFDKIFDDGKEDILEHIDLDSATKKVNIDFPLAMLREIDAEATRLGVARQALLKIWIDDRLTQIKAKRSA